MRKLLYTGVSLLAVAAAGIARAEPPQCPEFLNHEFRKLHSQETVNLCTLYSGKPMVFVNTASHCGFTKQFKGLEELYQAYKEQGVEVVGFPSDDFNQGGKNEEEDATICYKNFGVSFTMVAPGPVKGKDANPVFQYLNEKTQEPSWNFNKYLVTNDGATVTHFGSREKPRGSNLEKALKKAL